MDNQCYDKCLQTNIGRSLNRLCCCREFTLSRNSDKPLKEYFIGYGWDVLSVIYPKFLEVGMPSTNDLMTGAERGSWGLFSKHLS